MKIKCDYCQTEFNKKPSKIKAKNYCSQSCRSNDKTELGECAYCGLSAKRYRSASKGSKEMFCDTDCFRKWNSERFTESNPDWNSVKMTEEIKSKVRNAHLGKGEGKSYAKFYGKHEHRIVAEQKIGRPLRKGEVVHHVDENKRNNNPENLIVFKSQSEHVAWHVFIKNLKKNSRC